MSKFCGNCGGVLDDTAVVCGYCGAPVAPEVPQKKSVQINKEVVLSFINQVVHHKIFKIAAPCVAGLIVLLIVLAVVSGFTGHKGAVKNLMNAYEDKNADELYSLSSELYTRDQDSLEVIENINNRLDSQYETLEYEVGTGVEISYKVDSNKKLDERELSNYKEMFRNAELDYSEIKEGRRVTLEITYKGDIRENEKTITLIMLKEGKEWKFYQDSDSYYYSDYDKYDDYLDDVYDELF